MKISVVINNYNYGRYLRTCIESVLAQEGDAPEIIVVDDGSTDESVAIIEGFGPAIVPVLKPNGGQASALNAGFRAASGALVLFLDADDYLDPHALSAIRTSWRTDLCRAYWRLRKVRDDGTCVGVMPKEKHPLLTGTAIEVQLTGMLYCPPTSGNVFSRTFLERVMPIPETLFRICADSYLFARAPFFGDFLALPESLGVYRIHSNNRFHANPSVNRSRLMESVARGYFLNQTLIADATAQGLPVWHAILYKNYDELKNRAVSLVGDPTHHPIPNDSVGRLVGISWHLVKHPMGLSRLRRLAETCDLLRSMLLARLKSRS